MEDLELQIEQKLYSLSQDKLEELGEFLKVSVSGLPSRRYTVKKLREKLEETVEQYDEENLKKFLSDVWRVVSTDDEDPNLSTSSGEEGQDSLPVEEAQSNSAAKETEHNAKESANKGSLNSAGGVVMPELLSLRRDFKISGTIGGDSHKDRLSFVGLMRQVDSALTKGYKESEICDAVIRAISPSSKLKAYLELMADITLQKLRQIIRVHYKEKSSTELYQELTTMIQDPKESPQDFLLRALSMRERIIFASKADDSLKYDAVLVQSLFVHTLETGLRDEVIRNKFRSALKPGESTDEELMETLNKIVSVEGERQLKFSANRKENKAAVSSISSDDVKVTKPNKQMSNVMSTLEALQAQIAELNAKFEAKSADSPDRNKSTKASYQNQRRRRTCKGCEQRNVSECDHCFKCGSSDHLARGCKRNQGNGRMLPPRDRE